MSEEIGKRVGDYQILNELGAGGMGQVYRVRNVISDRIEAMKVLLPNLTGQQELAARFQREIKLMASLNHPNIAQLRTAFTADNQLVMIMEYVEGTNLAERLERGPIPVPEALNCIDQALSALSYAHKQGIIHRDIKPSNMMLTPQGVLKLMDFGIARGAGDLGLTMTGVTLGSLSYMSPEQVKGEATDARSDLYSLGVSLYEMVTGQRPFQSGSDYAIMSAHVKEAPRPPIELQPGLPSALNEIILMAISKDPALRFKSADAFRNALNSVRATLPAAPDSVITATMSTPPPGPAPTAPAYATPAPPPAAAAVPSVIAMTPPPSTGHRGLYMTLGALIVLVVLVAAGVYIPRRNKTQATSTTPAPASPASPASDDAAKEAPMPPPPPDATSQSSSTSPTSTPNGSPDNSQPATTASVPAADASAPATSPNSTQPKIPLAATHDVEVPPSAKAAPAKAAKKLSSKAMTMGSSAGSSQTEASPGSQEPAQAGGQASNDEIDEVEHEVDQLSNRAAAVNSSLDRLQQQQAASGYGLRGDMAARQASMKNNLAKAEDAAQHGDVARAKKYSKLAEADAEVLEHFLGH